MITFADKLSFYICYMFWFLTFNIDFLRKQKANKSMFILMIIKSLFGKQRFDLKAGTHINTSWAERSKLCSKDIIWWLIWLWMLSKTVICYRLQVCATKLCAVYLVISSSLLTGKAPYYWTTNLWKKAAEHQS